MILEQIDLVDIEKAAIGARQQPRLERFLAMRQRTLQIECADDTVLGRAERQVDHRHRHLVCFEPGRLLRLAARLGSRAALRALRGGIGRIALVGTADDGAHWRQQCGKRTHRSGLASAAITERQHAADLRIDGGDHQRQLHLVLADDGRERKGDPHRLPSAPRRVTVAFGA